MTSVVPDQQQIGSACGFGGSIRFAITTIATAICTVVVNLPLSSTVPVELSRAVTEAGLPLSTVSGFVAASSSGVGLDAIPGNTFTISEQVLAAYRVANADAYRTVFYTTIPFCVIGVISALLLPNIDDLMTSEVSTRLHKKDERRVLEEKFAPRDAE